MAEIEKNSPEKLLEEAGAEEEEEITTGPEVVFPYEFQDPIKEVTNLEQLKEIIIKHFPTLWDDTKACLSTACSLSLKNLNGCPSLNLVGNPSGEKTTALSFFYGHEISYISDDFTPRAFVSHAANVKEKNLEKVDLLPKIKNKLLVTPELAPLFEASKDKLLDNFSMLTRVLDGEGLHRDTGMHGHRGYSGDYKFAWLGATTPLRHGVWQIMGKLGNRLFFKHMESKDRTDDDYLEMFTGDLEYEEKVRICRGAVRSYLDNYFSKYPLRTVRWTNQQDIFIMQKIIRYAKLLSKLRGSLVAWRSSEEKTEYEYTFPIIEEPPRAINALRNFARGHALIHGRNYLKEEDLKLVKSVCLSSMPHDRYKFLQLIAKHEGKLSTEIIQEELACSDETARKTMKIFEVLGVVDIKKLPVSSTGRPMQYIELKPEFMELLNCTQGENGLENNNPSENNPVPDIDFSKSKIKEALEDG
jgi:hypothetical protein